MLPHITITYCLQSMKTPLSSSFSHKLHNHELSTQTFPIFPSPFTCNNLQQLITPSCKSPLLPSLVWLRRCWFAVYSVMSQYCIWFRSFDIGKKEIWFGSFEQVKKREIWFGFSIWERSRRSGLGATEKGYLGLVFSIWRRRSGFGRRRMRSEYGFYDLEKKEIWVWFFEGDLEFYNFKFR